MLGLTGPDGGEQFGPSVARRVPLRERNSLADPDRCGRLDGERR
jgi:hypothetical protein